MDIVQEIWENYKKTIIIVLVAIISFFLVVKIFLAIYNPVRITFTGDDSDIIATMSNEVRLGAKATNKSGDKFEIEWSVSDGSLSSTSASEVVWELPKSEGTYTISVKSGDKTISKNITVITNQIGNWSLKSNDNVEYIDSDDDGLSDLYEKEISNTDYAIMDTDGDVVNDGVEAVLKLDPKEKESKDDEKNLILDRGETCFCVMNLFPYNNGHLMVAPYRHTSSFEELLPNELAEMSSMIQKEISILKKLYNPNGFNIGMNIGTAGGAGVAGHLHWHIVPRWSGDSNFMPVIGKTDVVSVSLSTSYKYLKEANEKYV